MIRRLFRLIDRAHFKKGVRDGDRCPYCGAWGNCRRSCPLRRCMVCGGARTVPDLEAGGYRVDLDEAWEGSGWLYPLKPCPACTS